MKGFKRGLTRGFTLVELIIVIVIIGILAAVAVPQFTGVQDSAKEATYKANVASIQAQIVAYYSQNTATTAACAPGLLSTIGFTGATNSQIGTLDVANESGSCVVTASELDIADTGAEALAAGGTITLPWL